MSADEHCYTLATEYKSIKELKNSAAKIEAICEKYCGESESKPINFMTSDDLDEVIFCSEKSAVSCRKMKELQAQNCDYFSPETDVISFEDRVRYQIKVDVDFDGKVLKISTPFTFKNKYNRIHDQANYILQLYIRDALNRWQKDHNFDLFRAIAPPLVLVILRRTPSKVRNIADNDNIETGRISNTIMNALGVSDNWQNLSVYSLVQRTDNPDDAGMVFLIMGQGAFFDGRGQF